MTTADPRQPSPFAWRGVVEGFYGVYYTTPQRIDLIEFLGAHGYNWYIYGPKDDRQHRSRWREPYPAEALDDFSATVAAAERAGVTFCYALSPGPSICYSSRADFGHLTYKLRALHGVGVRAFSLFLDDISPKFKFAADSAQYASYAAAHVDLCNRTLAWLRELNSSCQLSMCPTYYHGLAPFHDYLPELGAGLDPAIDVFYTGPQVCSTTLSAEAARAFGEAVRRPPLIWDNYPVNDGAMEAELHIGPIRGRGPDLGAAVRGLAVNPMIQPEASKISLLTFAEYFADPTGYAPEAAWGRALEAVAGPTASAALRLVAETSLKSCLGTPEAAELEALTNGALAALGQGEAPADSAAVAALVDYLQRLDDAINHLRYRMRNLALRADLLPWLEQLENWCRVGCQAVGLLRAAPTDLGQGDDTPTANRARKNLQKALSAAQAHPKRIGGQVLLPLAELALARSPGEAA